MKTESDVFDLTDLSDLPQELRQELVVSKRDEFEKRLIELFKRAGRELNIDEIQAAYYRVHGEFKSRNKVTAKLYNMSRASNSATESVKGRKGVYRLREGFDE